MSNGLALALIIAASGLAALLSAAMIVYSIMRSRTLSTELHKEIAAIKKRLDAPDVYLGGLPESNGRKKNIILFSALRLFEDGKYASALAALGDVLPLVSDDKERCSLENLAGLCRARCGAIRDAEKTFLDVVATAQRNGLDAALAPALGNLGAICFTLGELERSLEYLQKALKIDEQAGRQKAQARELGSIGSVYFALAEQKKVFGHYQKAHEYYKRALKINEEIKDIEGQARELGSISAYYLAIGDSAKGLDFCEKALEAAERIENFELEVSQLNGLGIIYKTLERREEALACFEKALKKADHSGKPETKASTLANIGALYAHMGNNRQALDYFLKARVIYTRIGAAEKIAVCESNISRARRKLAEQEGERR